MPATETHKTITVTVTLRVPVEVDNAEVEAYAVRRFGRFLPREVRAQAVTARVGLTKLHNVTCGWMNSTGKVHAPIDETHKYDHV